MEEKGLYIHIPFCLAKCDYCDFFSVPCKSGIISDDYVKALLAEIKFYAEKYNVSSWRTVYFGGGTPGLLSCSQIDFLMKGIRESVPFFNPLEVTIECNPESITEEKLLCWEKNAIDRLSLGVQSLTQSALEGVHRHCTAERAEKSLSLIKKNWKGRLCLDVIAGLEFQNDEEFIQSLEKIVSYNPSHISLYALTVEENTPLGKRAAAGDFDFDRIDFQWLKGRDFLKSKGYFQYEVSNFCKKGFESIHNSSYWHQMDYIGAGSGGCSSVYGENALRWTNTCDINAYVDFWKKSSCRTLEEEIPCEREKLSLEVQEYEFLMTGFRTLKGVSSADYMKKFHDAGKWNGSLEKRLGESSVWKDFAEKGYASCSGERYFLTEEGILFLNKLLVDLC